MVVSVLSTLISTLVDCDESRKENSVKYPDGFIPNDEYIVDEETRKILEEIMKKSPYHSLAYENRSLDNIVIISTQGNQSLMTMGIVLSIQDATIILCYERYNGIWQHVFHKYSDGKIYYPPELLKNLRVILARIS